MYVETEVEGKKLEAMVDTGANTVYIAKELANEIRLPYKKQKGYVKGVIAKSLPILGVPRDADIQIGPWRGKVDITISPLDDRKFYLEMDFLDRAKAFIIPYVSTLFITANAQVHSILMRREAKKERVLADLRFSKDKESGYLAALKRDDKPMYVKPLVSSRKLAPRRKQASRKTRGRHTKDRHVEHVNATHQSNRIKGTPPGNNATHKSSIQGPKGNEDVARLGGGQCHGSSFRRTLEFSESSKIFYNLMEYTRTF